MNELDHIPIVSIGLPVYNGARFISTAIESLLAQDFDDFELVICDNASTDDTVSICEQFAARDARIRIHQNETNLGAGPNFSKVFELSRGKYFKWMAHDDWIKPSFVGKAVEVLDSHPDVVLCYAKAELHTEEGELEGWSQNDIAVSSDDPSERYLSFLNRINNSVFGLMRTEELKKTPLMSPIPGGDRPFLSELTLLGKFYLIPEYLLANRMTMSERNKRTGRNKSIWWSTANKNRHLPRRPALIMEYIRVIKRSEIPTHKKVNLYLRTMCEFSKIRRKTMVQVLKRDKMMPFREFGYFVGSIFGKLRKSRSG